MIAPWYQANPSNLAPWQRGFALGQNYLSGGGGQYVPYSGNGGGGGGNPAAGILADYLAQMRADYGAQSIQDAASRDAALKRLIISYGGAPDFAAQGGLDKQSLGFLNSVMTPEVLKLAQQNTDQGTSVLARMQHDNMLANRRIPATLAGRGLLHSGQTGADLAEQARGYKIQGFDTLNNMLNQATGVIGNYLQAEQQRQMALANAEMQAAMSAWQGWGGPTTAGRPPIGPTPVAPDHPPVYRPSRPIGPFGNTQTHTKFAGVGGGWF